MEDRAGKARWLSVSHAEKRCRPWRTSRRRRGARTPLSLLRKWRREGLVERPELGASLRGWSQLPLLRASETLLGMSMWFTSRLF